MGIIFCLHPCTILPMFLAHFAGTRRYNSWPILGLANPSEGVCSNCLKISKKFFRLTMGILKSKIRVWRPP